MQERRFDEGELEWAKRNEWIGGMALVEISVKE